MKYVFVDVETFYSKDYSLRRMTPVEYVLDPRFETIGWAVAVDDGDPFWCTPPEFVNFLATLDPNDTAVISHNALFDMCVLAWRFNFKPKLMIDTMSIARALVFYKSGSVSLENVATSLGIGVKGKAIHKVMGMGANAIEQSGMMREFIDYALNDVALCRRIWEKLKPEFPASELIVNDMLIRCAITPKLKLDQNKLHEHLHATKAAKEQLLAKAMLCGLDNGKKDLMSNEKFAEALRQLGVEPPMKTSPITGKQTYAFAKSDAGMIELEDHPNPAVQVMVAARLGHKSTLEESRTERFINISNLEWPGEGQAKWMPVPLRYAGAHTGRLSGDWSLNLQNLPRGGALRQALMAGRDDQVVFTIDASQIEARVVSWLAGCQKLVDAFARGEDVYSSFATTIYGYPVSKANKPERFMGKTGILGLGFGCGAIKFNDMVRIMAAAQNIQIEMDPIEAARVVGIYRSEYPEIPKLWKLFENALPGIGTGSRDGEKIGPLTLGKQKIMLPNGLPIFYHNLRHNGSNWTYDYGGKPKYIYGGKVVENVVQALARIVVMDAAVRARKRLGKSGIELAHTVHDELIYVVPRKVSNVISAIMLEEMKRRPTWAPELPLDAEAGVSANYGDAK